MIISDDAVCNLNTRLVVVDQVMCVSSQMDEEGSSAAAGTRSWGFRRSTIARREFMEAVVSVDSSPPVQRRRGRPPRGRGSRAKRGRGGRGRVPALAPAEHRSSSEREARETVPCPSDRAEDSDELNLQEIRKRAVARKLHELKRDDDAEDIDVGLLVEREESVSEITSGGGKVCSDTEAGVTAAEEEHRDEEQEELAENIQEDAERMNPDAVCCTCQQGHSNR